MWWFRSRWLTVAKVGDVTPGNVIAVNLEGVELVLGLDGDRYFAVQRRCPHRGYDLVAGFVADHHLVCRQHGWRFSTATGRHDGLNDACLAGHRVRIVGEDIQIDARPQRRGRGPHRP